MEIKGILKKVNEVVTRGNFTSRKVWITTDASSNYPQIIEVEVNGDKINLFDSIAVGSEVTCSINLRGREWTNPNTQVTSVFNTLQCWKVATANGVVQQPTVSKEDEPGDLPF